jgi:hypothetical protein
MSWPILYSCEIYSIIYYLVCHMLTLISTYSTTLSDNFQKNQLLLFELFSVGPALNLRYTWVPNGMNTNQISILALLKYHN